MRDLYTVCSKWAEIGKVENHSPGLKQASWGHEPDEADEPDEAERSHGRPAGAREPCACFPDDARSARQQAPSNYFLTAESIGTEWGRSVPIVADQQRSTLISALIGADPYQLALISANQRRSAPICAHWRRSEPIGADRRRSALIGADGRRMAPNRISVVRR